MIIVYPPTLDGILSSKHYMVSPGGCNLFSPRGYPFRYQKRRNILLYWLGFFASAKEQLLHLKACYEFPFHFTITFGFVKVPLPHIDFTSGG